MSCCGGGGGGDAFTAAQLEELGRQAMIYKHFVAGVPVPPDLLLPPSRSSCPSSSPLYYHPTLGYLSYYGKKLDPEPGRCRRTDGKKWRCTKDAHPDSKYCERHMHRNRNRSRKPVENKSLPQPVAATLRPSEEAGNENGSGSYTSFGSSALQHSRVHTGGYSTYSTAANSSLWQLDLGSYGLGNKDYRCPSGMKTELDQNSYISKTSGSDKGSVMDNPVNNSSWSLMPSEVLASFVSKGSTSSVLHNSSYLQLHSSHDMGQPALSSLSAQQQEHHSFFVNDYGLSDPGKHEAQPLRPFFDELPRTRGMWLDLEEEQSRKNLMSTTQLSISIPNGTSGYMSTGSRSSGGVPLL